MDASEHVTRDYIDGRFETTAEALPAWIHDASTGERLLPQAQSSPDAVERALAAAARAHAAGEWLAIGAAERARRLEIVAEHLRGRAEEIARIDAISTGVITRLTSMFAEVAAAAFRGAAAIARRRRAPDSLPGAHGEVVVHRLPHGPAAVIAPWNAPCVIAAHKTASALAAGCPVILKPSEHAPGSCELMAEAIAAAGADGLPAGVFQLVHGGPAIGARLVADARVRAVSFTGGLAGGRAVATACAADMKPAQLELGGNNPLVVLPGADLSAAAEGIVSGLTTMGGQWCRAVGRVLVPRDREAALLEAVRARLARVKLGSALDPASDMGPMVHQAHRDGIARAVNVLAEAGGTVHQVTPLPALGGWFYPPTLVSGLPGSAATEEIFGPVATVHTYDTEAEALALANQTRYGLAAYVFGDEHDALRLGARIASGVVKINGVGLLGLHPLAPRPAWGLSGHGDEGTIESFEFFRGTRVVGVAAGGAS